MAVIAFAVIAFGGITALRNLLYVPLLGSGSTAIHAAGSLPERMDVCGRAWNRSATYTMAQIAAMSDMPPAIVGAGLLPACPQGACARDQDRPCHTVVYVRVAEDGYVSYGLSGGP